MFIAIYGSNPAFFTHPKLSLKDIQKPEDEYFNLFFFPPLSIKVIFATSAAAIIGCDTLTDVVMYRGKWF